MYTSNSEDSDSDSGTNFKRGKRKVRIESPKESRKAATSSEGKTATLKPREDERNGRERRRDCQKIERKADNGVQKYHDSERRHSANDKHHSTKRYSKSNSQEKSGRHGLNEKRLPRAHSLERHREDDSTRKRSGSIQRSQLRRKVSPAPRRDLQEEPKREEFATKARHEHESSRIHQSSSSRYSKSDTRHHKGDQKHSNEATSRGFEPHSSTKSRSLSHHSNDSRKRSRHSSHEKAKCYGPALPSPSHRATENNDYMPALPPGFKQYSRDRSPTLFKSKPGPAPRKDFEVSILHREPHSRNENYDKISSDEDDSMIGPILPGAGVEMSERDLELEKRKIQMKLQQLDRRMEAVTSSNTRHREEWMLELPEIRKVPDMGLSARQFRKNERPDFSDRSSWTKTPNDHHKKHHHDTKESKDEERRNLDMKRRDDEQEKLTKELKKSHKRDKSLLELHEKKLKKEKVIIEKNVLKSCC